MLALQRTGAALLDNEYERYLLNRYAAEISSDKVTVCNTYVPGYRDSVTDTNILHGGVRRFD